MIKSRVKKIITRITRNNYETLNLVELSRSRLLHNVSYFLEQHPDLGIIPILKSNAYGHGLKQIAEILNDGNCDYLAVDGYFEAAKIQDITKHQILVLGYIKPTNFKLLNTKKCSFVIQDVASLIALGSLRRPVRIHMELNTGMNRLGLQPDEIKEYLRVLKSFPTLHLDGIMTHLADADNDQTDEYTDKQTKLFDKQVGYILAEGFRPKYIHIAQTAGSTRVNSKYANSIRVGIGLYGINPLSFEDRRYRDLDGLQPVLELKSTIIKVLNLKAGERVSYNGIFTAPQDMRIGVLPLGYYEGVPRELSNRGIVMLDQYVLPIVGRVCMNHTMIDLSDYNIVVGDQVTVISNDSHNANSVKQICKLNSLFSYSFLTGISESIRRVIVQ